MYLTYLIVNKNLLILEPCDFKTDLTIVIH
jgi:hypothetical protein